MLTALRIENFAIVDQLAIDFAEGMTAFTGETGAGKSILIDALMLALGARAEGTAVRAGHEKCDITATFSIDPDSPPAFWLAEHEAGDPESGEVILRRILYAEGRSKSFVNGQPFPLQKVRELSAMLVDIHGQHEHQSLLNHSTHRQQLDAFAGHTDLLDDVAALSKRIDAVRNRLKVSGGQGENSDTTEALLAFQIDELQRLAPAEGETGALHAEHQLLHHAREYLETLGQLENLLSADDTPNACAILNRALHLTTSLPKDNPGLANAFQLLESARIQCEEALDEIQSFAEKVHLDPERLNAVEIRMSELHQAARKYQVDPSQLAAHLEGLSAKQGALASARSERLALETELSELQEKRHAAALVLRESRQHHAIRLAREITETIQKLGMPKGLVEIAVTPLDTAYDHGMDRVEYQVCTNPGTRPDTLSKIASGGELSRISLAIHMITASKGATPTLLFDEVDTGIGGATAALVGHLLRNLGNRLQILCVTHQPQVAASAHHQVLVEKHTDNTQTWTRIVPLSESERIDEIARMLGGLTITGKTRSHARELLQQPETV